MLAVDLWDGSVTGGDRLRARRCRAGRHVEFVVVDLSDFDRTAEPESFDFITTFEAIHDQGKPLNVLKGIRRALTEGGVYLMQDINGSSQVTRIGTQRFGRPLYTDGRQLARVQIALRPDDAASRCY